MGLGTKTLICHNSSFFKLAKQVDAIENLESHLSSSILKYKYLQSPTSPKEACKKGQATVLKVKLNLPIFPKKISKPKIFVFGTPEHNAITIGRFIYYKNNFRFQLPRFHVGMPAQLDLEHAIGQSLQFPQIYSLFKGFGNITSKAFGINFTREGHLSEFQKAVFQYRKILIPFTIAHVEHAPSKNQHPVFKRVAKLCQINLEGLEPQKNKLLILSDNVASGMQQVAVGEYIVNFIKKQAKKHSLKNLLVAAPLLTIYGASIISLWAAQEGIATIFIASGGLLGSDSQKYFSPLLINKNAAPNPELASIHHQAHGEKASHKACARCNWTASFLSPKTAIEDSEKELRLYGSSNNEVKKYSKQITFETLKKQASIPPI